MPAGHVAVAHEQDLALAVDHHTPHAQRHSARETPVGVHETADQRFRPDTPASDLHVHLPEMCLVGVQHSPDRHPLPDRFPLIVRPHG